MSERCVRRKCQPERQKICPKDISEDTSEDTSFVRMPIGPCDLVIGSSGQMAAVKNRTLIPNPNLGEAFFANETSEK